MTSIYITSKKRIDSRVLWVAAIIILVAIVGTLYAILSPSLSPKSASTESSISTSSLSTMPASESSQPSISPMTTDQGKSTQDMNALTTSSASVSSTSTASTVEGKQDPMPAKPTELSPNFMSQPESKQPSISMDEILKQTNQTPPAAQ